MRLTRKFRNGTGGWSVRWTFRTQNGWHGKNGATQREKRIGFKHSGSHGSRMVAERAETSHRHDGEHERTDGASTRMDARWDETFKQEKTIESERQRNGAIESGTPRAVNADVLLRSN